MHHELTIEAGNPKVIKGLTRWVLDGDEADSPDWNVTQKLPGMPGHHCEL